MVRDVIVVGSGVIGLTCAVTLAEGGRRVSVWSREPAVDTTSAVAGGLWWPYRIEPVDAVGRWSLAALAEWTALAKAPEVTGVRIADGTHAGLSRAAVGAWADELPGLRPATAAELPAGFGAGLRARVPMVDMPTHLRYLERRLVAAGGVVEARALTSLTEAGRAAPLIVNCSGLGARELVPDPEVYPVQGQVLVVENPGLDEWLVAADPAAAETLYVLPQPYGVVLGGTARAHAWGMRPEPATAEAILARCVRVRPELVGARVIAHRVGLRPARPQVRLEAEELAGGARCVHNYGHGGAGVTVAWGCAREAAALANA
ncbi:FAD-dependent oxidoreductase [Streptomyces zagrosensis]|uniref:D-amino-acid oxidase n=1 Tax=Streptomyces zagrosensis TaxID=1042984 RepID=A0A7W9QBV1_9ACTN|nr:FAD-dependent oxidoreductase [Streptomyces zagrosensis]MBB5937251.1 D-amino-acid oxidase [Streptomyces zagrosensis]